MKRRNVLLAAVVGALAALAGCTAMQPSAPPVSRLALIGVPDPERLLVTIEKDPRASGSSERAMFYIAEVTYRAKTLAGALGASAFSASAEMTGAFEDALGRPGLPVLRVPNPRLDRTEFVQDYKTLRASAEVYVDVVPETVGYWADSPTGAIRPWVIVRYRAVDSRDGKVLAAGLIGTGPAPAGETAIAIAPDDSFAFASFDALTGDPARAAAGLRAAIRRIAQAAAQRLGAVVG